MQRQGTVNKPRNLRGLGLYNYCVCLLVCLSIPQSTEQSEAGMFDGECVLQQIKSLQLTPTVQLMAAGEDCFIFHNCNDQSGAVG